MATATRARKSAKQTAVNGELFVCGRGFRKGDFALVWFVPSQTEVNRWHQVTEITTGVFICDCRAAQFGRTDCKHRKCVRETLAAEEAEFQARIAQPPTTNDDEHARERETAILHRDSRPFSIWK